MRAPSHVTGGIVFTGVFASLWNVNIFAGIDTILFTCFASLLPDIDHTRSTLGKLFYPLARFIDRKYGHRTVTHSLLFMAVTFFVSATIENIFSDNLAYSIILFFGVFSHYLLDMITLQGIPFFYPFAKNPCVLPSNPEYRVKSGSKRAELAVIGLSVLLMFSCADLFKNGFWTSYNRAFGTLRHVHVENSNTDKLLSVEYNYIKNNKNYSGTAFLLESKIDRSVYFDNGVFILDKNDNLTQVVSMKPSKTQQDKQVNEIGFFNISFDSLQIIFKNKIVSGRVQSSAPVEIIEDNIKKNSALLKLEHSYNSVINISVDTASISILQKIEKLKLKLGEERKAHNIKSSEITQLESILADNKVLSKSSKDPYLKNKYQKQILKLKSQIISKKASQPNYSPNSILLYEISVLESKLSNTNLTFSGLISYPVLPEKQCITAHNLKQ